jgi:predicted MFS family arabinose efflux permease
MLTLIYAAYVFGNLVALILFGGLSDRIGRRRTALPGIAVAAASALVFLFAGNIASLFIGRILSGLGVGVGAGTAIAWLAQLIADEDKSRATAIATSANFLGLALGALVAGLLAQYAPWPLRLPFIVYLVALLGAAALVWRTRETVSRPTDGAPLRPHISVPQSIRALFVAPAVAGFGAMALVGLYAALEPSIVAESLHQRSHALAGALFFELAVIVSVVIIATQWLSSRAAMLSALALMLPSVVLVVAAQAWGSMPIMIAATATCGVTAALGYRGSLQVVNEIASRDRRAELVSAYFVSAFCGNGLPVIGVGVVSVLANALAASMAFAGLIIVFAVVALFFGVKYTQ